MDPYEVLGIPYNSSWKEIRNAYKLMLYKTHPDKMGHSHFFDTIQSAYKSIKSQHAAVNRQSNYPSTEQKYEHAHSVQKPNEQFNINSFNKMFEQYASMYNEGDPYMNGGYSTDKSLNYQEDIEKLKNRKIKVPKRELVIFKEPEALPSCSSLENVQHLGINSIDDYSCRNGSDYMKAYSEEAELIDNRQQYNDLDHIINERSNQSFQLTREDKRSQQKTEKERQKLEQLRRQQLEKNDKKYENIYNYIQNRIK